MFKFSKKNVLLCLKSFSCSAGLRLRPSVWLQFSVKPLRWLTICPGTPPSTTSPLLKTPSTAINTPQPTTHLTTINARWHLTAPPVGPHPATVRAQIQFRPSRDWTLRQQLRFWTQQRGSASWTPRVVGVRVRPTLLQDTAVRNFFKAFKDFIDNI